MVSSARSLIWTGRNVPEPVLRGWSVQRIDGSDLYVLSVESYAAILLAADALEQLDPAQVARTLGPSLAKTWIITDGADPLRLLEWGAHGYWQACSAAAFADRFRPPGPHWAARLPVDDLWLPRSARTREDVATRMIAALRTSTLPRVAHWRAAMGVSEPVLRALCHDAWAEPPRSIVGRAVVAAFRGLQREGYTYVRCAPLFGYSDASALCHAITRVERRLEGAL